MFAFRLRTAVVAVASTLALSACAGPYGGLGVGYGSGGYYGGYGSYGSYGGYSPYGYGSYGYDPYSSYGYGYGSAGYPYGGWYDNYYYPGSGYYVYGRDGTRRRWTSTQQRYWESRRHDRGGGHQWHRDRDGDKNSGWTRQTRRWTERSATTPQSSTRPTTRESAGRKRYTARPLTTEEKKD